MSTLTIQISNFCQYHYWVFLKSWMKAGLHKCHFFCLGHTGIMREFSYAYPHGGCMSLLRSLENIIIKGRKRDYGGIPQRNDRSLWDRDSFLCHDSLWFSKEAIPIHFHQALYSLSSSWSLPTTFPTARRTQHHPWKTAISYSPSINMCMFPTPLLLSFPRANSTLPPG